MMNAAQTERILAELSLLPGVNHELTALAQRNIRAAAGGFMSACGREDVPEKAEAVIADMAYDMLKAQGVLPEGNKPVKSISRGDTAITYADSTVAAQNVLGDYSARMIPFKKLRVPK